MNRWVWLAAFALVVPAVVYASQRTGIAEHGADWKDAGPDGHSRLVDALSERSPVRIVEVSLASLPDDADQGDTLYLFPSYRRMTSVERTAVDAFLDQGGSLIIAADGPAASMWLDGFGVPLHGFPVLLAETGRDCVPVVVPVQAVPRDACLPSPSAFLDLEGPLGLGALSEPAAFNSTVPIVIDLDGDGNHSLADQGPSPAVVSIRWNRGNGTILVVADGDLWRNDAIARWPENRALAVALADADGRIYVESSSTTPEGVQSLGHSYYRVLFSQDLVPFVAAALAVVIIAATAARAARWPRHRSNVGAEDPLIEDAIRAAMSSQASSDESQESRT